MAKVNSFDSIHVVSIIKVVGDEGFFDVTGVAKGMFILTESSKSGKAVGIYGNDLDDAAFFYGEDRSEVIDAFVSSNMEELCAIFGDGKTSPYFCELIGGGLAGDLSDFEFENDCSVSISDAENELELEPLFDRVGLSVSSVLETKVAVDVAKKVIRYNKQDITYLGDLFNELQYEGETRLIILS
jgi:hypothetical protein